MNVRVNGSPREVEPGCTAAALVAALGMDPRVVLLELNEAVLPRGEWGRTVLAAGDCVELFRVAAGG